MTDKKSDRLLFESIYHKVSSDKKLAESNMINILKGNFDITEDSAIELFNENLNNYSLADNKLNVLIKLFGINKEKND